MKIVKDKIEIAELNEMAKKMYENLVKVAVDVDKKIMAVDAPMHADLEEILIEEEKSEPENIWGINIWPEKDKNEFIEFDSMINIKPGWGNKTRGVDDVQVREEIIEIVNNFIK